MLPWLALPLLAGCAKNGADYAPDIDPARFSSTVDNPFLSFPPGTSWIYSETSKDDDPVTITVTVGTETKEVRGVTCVDLERLLAKKAKISSGASHAGDDAGLCRTGAGATPRARLYRVVPGSRGRASGGRQRPDRARPARRGGGCGGGGAGNRRSTGSRGRRIGRCDAGGGRARPRQTRGRAISIPALPLPAWRRSRSLSPRQTTPARAPSCRARNGPSPPRRPRSKSRSTRGSPPA